MKIRRIKLQEVDERPLLNGLEMFFTDDNDTNSIDPNCFIGVNGSGKSQLLETIAEIFYYLDRIFRKINKSNVSEAPCLFEIDYSITIRKRKYEVQIRQEKKNKAPEYLVLNSKYEELAVQTAEFENFLPVKVIGYTSGDNEMLSVPFMDYYDEYADHTARRALKKEPEVDYEPRFYFMDYNTNKGVVIANLILGKSGVVKKILDTIQIDSIRNFQIVIQTNHKAAKGKGRNGIQLTNEHKQWINDLKKIATAYEFDAKSNTYILDFYINKCTKDAFKTYFKTSINLYTALYKIELLNNLIIDKKYREEIKKQRRERKLFIKTPTVPDQDKVLNYSEIKLRLLGNQTIDYIKLSDGEHQFLNIFGTILMIDQNNALFLLDEPETHFNPKWRREFVQLWNNLTIGRIQDNFITSHSPFVVSDSKKDKVYIFKKLDNHLEVRTPSKETYGSSFDFVLKTAFKLDTTLSEKSFLEIKALLDSNDAEEIQERLPDFGESSEKFYLLKKIEEIKLKDQANAS